MKHFYWVIGVLGFFIISACGKKGDLVYEGESEFPRTYPSGNDA
jgi:hypothetical protein